MHNRKLNKIKLLAKEIIKEIESLEVEFERKADIHVKIEPEVKDNLKHLVEGFEKDSEE